MNHIADGTPYAFQYADDFPFQFFAYESMGRDVKVCEQPALTARPETTDRKLYTETAPDRRE